MTDIRSERPDELLASPEVRQKALELLRTRGFRTVKDIEKMLGWEGPIRMPDHRMAQLLGVTKNQLRYMLFRTEQQKKSKERRIAEKETRNLAFTTYTSDKLKFTISFPAIWRVTTDTLWAKEKDINPEQFQTMIQKVFLDSGLSMDDIEGKTDDQETKTEDSAEEAYQKLLEREQARVISFEEFEKAYGHDRGQSYRLFFKKLMRTLSDDSIEALASRELTALQAYRYLMEDPETFLVSFPKFKEYHEWTLRRQRQKNEDEAELHRMELGLFVVSSSDNEDFPSVDIVKLGLIESITALELYKMDKPLSEHALTGNRPKWGVDVDGMHGEKYYYIPAIHSNWLPKFLNVYVTAGDTGWIISCSCKVDVFDQYKPVFERIINSFLRV